MINRPLLRIAGLLNFIAFKGANLFSCTKQAVRVIPDGLIAFCQPEDDAFKL